jgi:ankyrin repeat protein
LARIGGDLNFVEEGRNLIERAVFDTDRCLYELCKAGADLNRTAVLNAMPPIFLSLLMTHVKTIETFCKYGIDVNILYDVRLVGIVTPIIYILDRQTYTKPDDATLYEIFMLLLPRSDLSLADSNGDTPLEFAKKKGLVKYALAIARESLKRKTKK